jgi:hypothetical protein
MHHWCARSYEQPDYPVLRTVGVHSERRDQMSRYTIVPCRRTDLVRKIVAEFDATARVMRLSGYQSQSRVCVVSVSVYSEMDPLVRHRFSN